MPEQLLQVSKATDSNAPSYLVQEAKIAKLEIQHNDAYDETYDIISQHGPYVQKAVEQVNTAYADTYGIYDDGRTDAPQVSQWYELSGRVPRSIIESQIATEAVSQAIKESEKDLELHAPEKALDVLSRVRALEDKIDYHKVVAQLHEPGMVITNRLSFLSASRMLMEAGVKIDYETLRFIDESVPYYGETWLQSGLLLAETGFIDRTRSGNNLEEFDKPFTEEEIRSVREMVERGQKVYAAYKSHRSDFSQSCGEVMTALDDLPPVKNPAITATELRTTRKEIYNLPFRRALQYSARCKVAALTAQYFEADTTSDAYNRIIEAAKNIDIEQVMASMEFVGNLDELPYEVSEAEMKIFLVETIPPIALARTKRVSFRELTPEEDPEKKLAGFNRTIEGTDYAEIVISTTQIRIVLDQYKSACAGTGFDSIAVAATKCAVNRTLLHEFGHSLHAVLPYAALKDWQDAATSDKTKITKYVKNMDDSQHYHREMEDFADSLKFFVDKPAILQIISDKRFQAMRLIYEAFMPNYENTLKIQQAKKIRDHLQLKEAGITSDQAMRDTYLSHEVAPK